jgi:hypothetical protein
MNITPEMKKIAADGKMTIDKIKEPEMHSTVDRWNDRLVDFSVIRKIPNQHRAPSSSRIMGMLDEK